MHFTSVRKNSWNEDKTILLSYSFILLGFLFESSIKRLFRFIIIGSSSTVNTGYGYVKDYLFSTAVRVTNQYVRSTVIVRV